jgi:hypothetical protein
MVAYTGLLLQVASTPFVRNFTDENGILTGNASPQSQLRDVVVNVPSSVQDGVGSDVYDIIRNVGTGITIQVLPITVHDAIISRTNHRGEGNTGRFQMLGKAPQDGMGIGFDYWEKILLQPPLQAMGNIVSETVFPVTLQNTFRRDTNQVTTINNNAGDGITITGPALPHDLKPFKSQVYTVTVTTSGPPNINGNIQFVTNIRTASMLITGTRIIIFPYAPQRNLDEKLTWLTDIVKSADGSEQRHALRTNPRQSVGFEVIATTQFEINSIKNLLVDWTTRVFGVPLWWDEKSLAADVAINDTVISVRNGALANADFRPGGLGMIYQEDDEGNITSDVLQIDTVTVSPSVVTFLTGVTNAYDGSKATIIPVVAGILATPASQGTSQDTESSRFSMNFDLLDNDETQVPAIGVGTYPELDDFNGRNLMVINDINFMSEKRLSEQWSQNMQRVDFDLGTFFQLTQELAARRQTPFRWRIEDQSFGWQIRTLLFELKGRLRSVWLPTWRDDFEVVVNIGNGAGTIDVANWGFTQFSDRTPWAGLRLRHIDGSISYHRITSSAIISDTVERLTISPVTSFAMDIVDVLQVDLLILSRQSDDTIMISHDWIDAQSEEVDETVVSGFVGDVMS